MTDEEWKAKIEELIRDVEQLPVLRVSFGGRDAESGYEVCPQSVMRHKIIGILRHLVES